MHTGGAGVPSPSMIDEDVGVRDNSGLSNLPPSLEYQRANIAINGTRGTGKDPWSADDIAQPEATCNTVRHSWSPLLGHSVSVPTGC